MWDFLEPSAIVIPSANTSRICRSRRKSCTLFWKWPVLRRRRATCRPTESSWCVIPPNAGRWSMSPTNRGFIAEAPVCLVFCADPARSAATFGERGARLYAVQDATIAAAYAQLAIVAAGMGFDLGRLLRRRTGARRAGSGAGIGSPLR